MYNSEVPCEQTDPYRLRKYREYIISPDSAPVKRLVQKAKESGTVIDATQGRKTKSVLVMESSQIVLSALLPETIAGRAQGALSDEDADEGI